MTVDVSWIDYLETVHTLRWYLSSQDKLLVLSKLKTEYTTVGLSENY